MSLFVTASAQQLLATACAYGLCLSVCVCFCAWFQSGDARHGARTHAIVAGGNVHPQRRRMYLSNRQLRLPDTNTAVATRTATVTATTSAIDMDTWAQRQPPQNRHIHDNHIQLSLSLSVSLAHTHTHIFIFFSCFGLACLLPVVVSLFL